LKLKGGTKIARSKRLLRAKVAKMDAPVRNTIEQLEKVEFWGLRVE